VPHTRKETNLIAMRFDPAKPAASTPLSSAAMRGQLTVLKTDIHTRAAQAQR